jgi:quercetin dioxygenase-like cupin family protein
MIVKASQAQPREFKGVAFDLLAVGPQSMVTKMRYRSGNRVPEHSHPNERSGYVISGKYRLLFANVCEELAPGDSYSIPANVIHSLEILEPGEVVDVFTPPRADYLHDPTVTMLVRSSSITISKI